MPDWPAGGGGLARSYGESLGGSSGTSVAAGTANVKGSWVQMTASTEFAGTALMFIANFPSASCLADIGIGAAGSERIIVPDILNSAVFQSPPLYSFPVAIPTGARIAVRVASTSAGASCSTTVYVLSGGFSRSVGHSRIDAYGVDTTDSGGTSIDPGATINTKGAWVQITASTVATHKALAMSLGNQANTVATATPWLFDIGVGGAGSEQIVLPNFRLQANAAEVLAPSFTQFFPVDIPEGTRLAVRSQCAINDATDRLLDVVLYGAN